MDQERPPTPVTDENDVDKLVEHDASESLILPLSRVRKIIKYDSEVSTVREDAVTAIARATELFLEYFLEETYREATSRTRGRVKRLNYNDFSKTVQEIEALHFLAESPALLSRPLCRKMESKLQLSNARKTDSARTWCKNHRSAVARGTILAWQWCRAC
jgi:histone H3/H4